jgi:hypothetical protein
MTALTSHRIGIGISALVIVMLMLDAGGKLFAPEMMIANSPPLGLPADPDFHRMLGAILAVALILYAFPRTAVLGAILLTGYLGGAVALTCGSEARCSATLCSGSTSARSCGWVYGCANPACAR